jgi:putative heme iron utilization protein
MLLRQADRAALGTFLADQARPYVSLVGVATDIDGAPILLLSQLAEHTQAILKNPLVSLLIDGTAEFHNPQQGPRVTLLGHVVPGGDERLGRRFLARHPAAALYAGFGDFSFYTLIVERMHWVGGFGRAQWLAPRPACDASVARAFDAALPEVRAAILRHHADALGLIARRRLKKRSSDWHLAGIDPDGCDLARGKTVHRLAFPDPLASPDEVMAALIGLTRDICAS